MARKFWNVHNARVGAPLLAGGIGAGGGGRGGDPSLGAPSRFTPQFMALPLATGGLGQAIRMSASGQARAILANRPAPVMIPSATVSLVTNAAMQAGASPAAAQQVMQAATNGSLTTDVNTATQVAAAAVAAGVDPGVAAQVAQAATSTPASPSPLGGGGGAPAPLQGAQGASLQQNGPTQGRRQNLGFPTTTSTAAATSSAQSAPQTWFRPDRLFIASGQVNNFTVGAVLVGNKEQFVNANPCPANMFSELAVNADVEYDTCEPAVTIAVQLINQDTTASHTVTPGMTGRSAY